MISDNDLMHSKQWPAAPAKPQTTATNSSTPAKEVPAKYRHVAAVHARSRISCLSSEAEQSPSFLGFRNLMVIVLSKSLSRHPHLNA